MKLLIEYTADEFQHAMEKGLIAKLVAAGAEFEDQRASRRLKADLNEEKAGKAPAGFVPADEVPFDTDEEKPEESVTMEEVRAELNRANKAGKSAEIKKLFKKFGASQFPDIDPSDYAAVLAEAKKL